MSIQLKEGDIAYIVGLAQRRDLNGKCAILLSWSQKRGRWDIRCEKSGEAVRVKPDNLRGCHHSYLHPALGNAIRATVRGGTPLDAVDYDDSEIGTGQFTRMAFEVFVKIATELYSDAPEAAAAAMIVDFIGKEDDSKLLFNALKTRLQRLFGGLPFLPPTTLCGMDTADEVIQLLFNARMGTLAYIESQQAILKSVLPRLRNFKIKSDNRASLWVLSGLDGSKSRKRESMKHELISAAMDGHVDVAGAEGYKEVEVNPLLHRAYVEWLMEDVLPTSKPSDAEEGTLGEWHLIQDWERQLISSINVTPALVMLDIADSFIVESWLHGFTSFDLSALEAVPGLDVDRRIARFAFFAVLACEAAITTGIDSDSPDDFDTPSSSAESPVASLQLWKEGAKVVVVNLDKAEKTVCNGMEGRVVCSTEPGRYKVSFSNLEHAIQVAASNLQATRKVEREQHFCLCGNNGTLLCGRCSRKWYCSESCQASDFKTHKAVCKALVSKNPMMELMKEATKTEGKPSADE
jgi:hypothetical protein